MNAAGITMVSNSERSGEYLLEMSNINKSFHGVKALDNVNLKVRRTPFMR